MAEELQDLQPPSDSAHSAHLSELLVNNMQTPGHKEKTILVQPKTHIIQIIPV